MKRYYTDLFKFNEWANTRLLIFLEEEGIKDDRVLEIYSHLISAQTVWLLRIKDLPTSPFPLWEKYKLSELRTMNEESNTNWLKFIHGHRLQTFEEMIGFYNSQGARYEHTVAQIINQVITHSAYHRGQINSRLKELAAEEIPVLEYIEYKRKS
ncbi:MAG: DinB family protein [Cyclobacteriaceae bacterium]|nr:DinB family protein [Cyclobacteriaceae bacterium]